MKLLIRTLGLALLMASPLPALGQDAAEMAKRLQDPLGNIFNSGNDQTSYGFPLQPVYAMPEPCVQKSPTRGHRRMPQTEADMEDL